ncbi:hypothetical protein AB0F77_20900 [Streptomyces sp. NPDC026672]|uniref:hypothetical protein n=1 Tax=unclassified Streptomyces TaxID=2593676 RepID=UPI0034067E5F
MEPERTDTIVGRPELLAAFIANYACGHCNSATEVRHDDHGNPHLITHHDEGCPVLAGVLPSAPDVVRAITGRVPDTFRP